MSTESAEDAWDFWMHYNWSDDADMEYVERAFLAGYAAVEARAERNLDMAREANAAAVKAMNELDKWRARAEAAEAEREELASRLRMVALHIKGTEDWIDLAEWAASLQDQLRSAKRSAEAAEAQVAAVWDVNIEQACKVMHDAYERAATLTGWLTQGDSRKPWADVPEANKATMRAAVAALLDWLAAAPLQPHPLNEAGDE